jgi:hypothetical protein
MGKYKHEGKGRNISVSGGQERKDLFKDMSGGYNVMGDSNQPLYKYNGSVAQQRYSSATPLEGNAFGYAMQKAGGDYDKAKSMLEMKGSPVYQGKRKHQVSGVDSKASEPKGNMKGLNKKTAPMMPVKQPEQTARIETRMKTVYPDTPLEKSGCVSGSGSNAPYKLIGDPDKKMDKLSARHKKLYDRFEMGQTSEAEEQRMYRLEDRMDKVGKKIKRKNK